jgi:NAD(P)-dependent dehydrogenase (short-subunit alcohol dehydrogenase family)
MASLPVTNAVYGLGVAAGAYLAARSAIWFFGLMQTAVAIATKPALRKYGRWAVVTGATDGIGKAYAKQLLKAGLDVILVSRTQSKLDATAAELAAKFPTREIKTIAFDFTVTVESGAYDGLKTRIAELTGGDLGVVSVLHCSLCLAPRITRCCRHAARQQRRCVVSRRALLLGARDVRTGPLARDRSREH